MYLCKKKNTLDSRKLTTKKNKLKNPSTYTGYWRLNYSKELSYMISDANKLSVSYVEDNGKIKKKLKKHIHTPHIHLNIEFFKLFN